MKTPEQELNEAHDFIQNMKYWHLGRLSAIAEKELQAGNSKDAKAIKEAIDFVENYLK